MIRRLRLSKGVFIITMLIVFDCLLLGYIWKHQARKQAVIVKNIPVLDKLIVSRAADSFDNLPALQKTITDKTKIIQLYNDIQYTPKLKDTVININGRNVSLPRSCPIDYFARYILDFYQANNMHILHVVYDPTGCRILQVGSNDIRESLSGSFSAELQRILGLSNRDFYGSQNGRQN